MFFFEKIECKIAGLRSENNANILNFWWKLSSLESIFSKDRLEIFTKFRCCVYLYAYVAKKWSPVLRKAYPVRNSDPVMIIFWKFQKIDFSKFSTSKFSHFEHFLPPGNFLINQLTFSINSPQRIRLSVRVLCTSFCAPTSSGFFGTHDRSAPIIYLRKK